MSEATGPVSVGVLLPTREARIRADDNPAPLLELAREAELLGFDSVWAGDSPIARPRLEPLTLLAAVAARTERVTVGTAVLLAALRSPLITAHALASLDRLAQGRLVVGLGAGFPLPATEAEFTAAGVPFNQRVGRLMETVAIWRALWTSPEDAPVSHDGRYWRLADVELHPAPVQPGGPPLWLAGSSPRALERVGTTFDGWLPYPPTTEQFAEQLAEIERAAADAGRSNDQITPAMYATIALEDDPARAEAMLAEYANAYYGLPIEVMRQVQAFHAGGADSCARFLDEYIRAGARHLVLRFATLEQPLEMVRRAGEELVPALRELVQRSEAPA